MSEKKNILVLGKNVVTNGLFRPDHLNICHHCLVTNSCLIPSPWVGKSDIGLWILAREKTQLFKCLDFTGLYALDDVFKQLVISVLASC